MVSKGFNELNSVEHFIINCLTGTNLNTLPSSFMARESSADYGTTQWKYVSSEQLQRDNSEVLVERELKEALCRINPEIAAQPERADEVIHYSAPS